MSSIPFSLKYRPKKLDDVIGQEVVVQTLKNSFSSKNLHHAYILEGQFGCGKTTVARIMAAMENCESGPTLEPCGKCQNCKEIFNGSSIDIKEIDAASNRGIDDIRDLQKEINFSPINCKSKYIIIDEAHSLTGAAAEAALKMIEEPPPNVRFILCVAGDQKIYNGKDFVNISDINVGENIYTENGFSVIKNKFYKGQDYIYELLTEKGSVLKITKDHKIKVFDGEKILWKEANSITDKDYLPIFHSYSTNDNCCNLNMKECEFLGRLVGDGYYNHYTRKNRPNPVKRLGILFNDSEIDFGRSLLNALGYSYKEYHRGKVYDITIHNSIKIHKRLGLENYKTGQKSLPKKVYQFNHEQFKYFLKGLIGADGYINKRGYKVLYSSNAELLQELKLVSNSHAYHTNIRFNKRIVTKKSETTNVIPGVYNSHVMLFLKREPTIKISDKLRNYLINNYDSCKTLKKIIGYGKRYHLSKLMLSGVEENGLEYLKNNCCFEKFKSLTKKYKTDVYDLEMDNESHSFIANGFSVHNCTTEPEALKPTIHSRCINFNFSKISWMELYSHLVNIVKKESLQYEEDALKMIAKASKGSARNALQNLQTVTNFVGSGTMTTDSVSKSLGVIDEEMFFQLFIHISELKASEAMIDIDGLLIKGKRVRTIIDGISDHLRNMLIFRTCINNISEFGFNDEEIKKYSHQSKSFNAALIAKIMGLLVDAQSAVFINLSPQNYLEKFVFESIIEVIKDQKKSQKK